MKAAPEDTRKSGLMSERQVAEALTLNVMAIEFLYSAETRLMALPDCWMRLLSPVRSGNSIHRMQDTCQNIEEILLHIDYKYIGNVTLALLHLIGTIVWVCLNIVRIRLNLKKL
jgi:hypothetical protein